MRDKVYRLVGDFHTNYGWLLANKAIARRFWVQHLYSLRNLTFEQLLQNNFLSGIITIICNLKMSPNICHEINEWTLITVTEILQWIASPLFKCSLQTLRFKLRPLPMSSQCVTEKKGKSGRWKLKRCEQTLSSQISSTENLIHHSRLAVINIILDSGSKTYNWAGAQKEDVKSLKV